MLTDRFDAKHPLAKIALTFDFTLQLATGEVLTGVPSVSCIVQFGTDASPSAVLNGAANVDSTGKLAIVPVQAGVDGVDYLLTVSCASTNPQKSPAMNAILPVRI